MLAARLPGLQQHLFRLLSRDIGNAALLAGDWTADQRMAAFLVGLSRRLAARGFSPDRFQLTMARTDIANYLRLAPETVSRVLKRFQDEGLLRVDRREVRDCCGRERLEALAAPILRALSAGSQRAACVAPASMPPATDRQSHGPCTCAIGRTALDRLTWIMATRHGSAADHAAIRHWRVRMSNTRKLWMGLAVLLVASFAVLLWVGQRDLPRRAADARTGGGRRTASVVYTRADIETGPPGLAIDRRHAAGLDLGPWRLRRARLERGLAASRSRRRARHLGARATAARPPTRNCRPSEQAALRGRLQAMMRGQHLRRRRPARSR